MSSALRESESPPCRGPEALYVHLLDARASAHGHAGMRDAPPTAAAPDAGACPDVESPEASTAGPIKTAEEYVEDLTEAELAYRSKKKAKHYEADLGGSVHQNVVWMERKVKKLEAEAAACQEIESANGLLRGRLNAAKKTSRQRQQDLRNQITQRSSALHEFEVELESLRSSKTDASTKANNYSLGEYLSNELQNLLRTSHGGKMQGAFPKARLHNSKLCPLWPPLQDQGSLFWAATELEAIEACVEELQSSVPQKMMPEAMAEVSETEQLAHKLATQAKLLVNAAAQVKSQVGEEELNLSRNVDYLQTSFCALSRELEPLYTALAVDLVVVQEALNKQAQLIYELEDSCPALKNINANKAAVDSQGGSERAILVAAKLIAQARDLAQTLNAAVDPFPPMANRLRHGIDEKRSQACIMRAALASAQMAVDREVRQPNPQTVRLERQLQASLAALRKGVRKAIDGLQFAISGASGTNTAAQAGAREEVQAQQQTHLGLGGVSKHVLTLFCGSASVANKELARASRCARYMLYAEHLESDDDTNSMESFGASESDDGSGLSDVDGRTMGRAMAMGRRKSTAQGKLNSFEAWVLKEPQQRSERRRSVQIRRQQVAVSLAAPQNVQSVTVKRRASAPPRSIASTPDPVIVRQRQPSAPPKIMMWQIQADRQRARRAKKPEYRRNSLVCKAPSVKSAWMKEVQSRSSAGSGDSSLQPSLQSLEPKRQISGDSAAAIFSSGYLIDCASQEHVLETCETPAQPPDIPELLCEPQESLHTLGNPLQPQQHGARFRAIPATTASATSETAIQRLRNSLSTQPQNQPEQHGSPFQSSLSASGTSNLVTAPQEHALCAAEAKVMAQSIICKVKLGLLEEPLAGTVQLCKADLLSPSEADAKGMAGKIACIAGQLEAGQGQGTQCAAKEQRSVAEEQGKQCEAEELEAGTTQVPDGDQPTSSRVAKVLLAGMYTAAARAQLRRKRQAMAKKHANAKSRVCSPRSMQSPRGAQSAQKVWHCVKNGWRAEAPSQMSIVKGEYLRVWSRSATEEGWVYAERHQESPHHEIAKAGWLPARALKRLPESRRWVRTSRAWQPTDDSQCCIASGILVLVWTDSRTSEGWTYVEASMQGDARPGWLPDACLAWTAPVS